MHWILMLLCLVLVGCGGGNDEGSSEELLYLSQYYTSILFTPGEDPASRGDRGVCENVCREYIDCLTAVCGFEPATSANYSGCTDSCVMHATSMELQEVRNSTFDGCPGTDCLIIQEAGGI